MPAFATRPARPFALSAPTPGRWLAALHRGLDALVAFATLRDAELDGDDATAGVTGRAGRAPGGRATPTDSPARVSASHPHRRPLRAPVRRRRPGAVRPSPQPCTTPLAVKRPARRPDPVADKRR